MSDLISREEAIEAIEEYADRLQMVNWKENPNVPYKVHSLNWCINTIRDLPSIDAVNHTADYDEKNDILFVHLSPDNSNSYGEEIDKNIIIMRDMDCDEITGVMLYGFNKYIKNDSEKQATIDAVQVIRCKDCKWYGRADKRRFYRGMDCLQKRIGSIVPERDFCSRGERKES